MKELSLDYTSHAVIELPDSVIEELSGTRANIVRRSSIAWGEHCSECAFPSCYTSCEFYTPRQDLHCRRFAFGIQDVEVRNAHHLAGLTQIQFRRWGKLEGNGNKGLVSRETAARLEAQTKTTARLFEKLPLPRRVSSALIWRLNEQRKSKLGKGNPLPATANAGFMIEAYWGDAPPLDITLTILPWDKSQEGLFQANFTIQPGYNKFFTPLEAIGRSMPLDIEFAVQIEVVGDPPDTSVIFGLVDFVELKSEPHPEPGKVSAKAADKVKCVIWDLDDTVWTGTLVEDGIDGLIIKPEVIETMRLLDSRGILNAVASKNDAPLARAALEHFKIDHLILHPQINWGPKSDSIRRISEALDIGIDTFAFIDDQPFERAEVAAAWPSVRILTPEDILTFPSTDPFDVPVTAESKSRREMYRAEESRHIAASAATTDYLSFLRSCDIQLDILPINAQNSERVYELTQRTNQLNVTGARFSREEVAQLANGTHAHRALVMRCADQFGDYGIIGCCILNEADARIEAFFMSCRVQRKRVEHAFFAWLCNHLSASTAAEMLRIRFKQTPKNGASVKMFEDLGFTLHTEGDGGEFCRDLRTPFQDSDIVRTTEAI